MDSVELEQLSARAFEALAAAGGDPSSLAEPAATVVIVYSAQGIIDNGGLPYFFYSDFPDSPEYTLFSRAYERIGASEAAQAILSGVALFPFAQPHLAGPERRAFLDAGTKHGELMELSDKICGNEQIWQLLAEYAHAHAAELGAA